MGDADTRGAVLPGRISTRAAVLALATLLAAPAIALAQAGYPSRPIRLIVPFPPGGSTTIVARLVGQKLTDALGQQVVIDNRGGGNTIIGSEALVKAAPDGHTLLLVTSTHVINPSLLATPYDAIRDFAPIATVVGTETLMIVNTGLAAQNLQEFIALAKAKPGQLNFGSSGSGTTNHLAVELFSVLAGVKMQHIPYKGAGPAVTDLIGGQVQMFMNNAVPLIPFVKSGRVRAIAISGPNRLASLPDVPTFGEAGLKGYDVKSWQGILAPARTPAPVIDRLAQEIARILRAPDFADNLVAMGAEAFISTPQQFGELMKADLAKYARIIRQANIRIE